MRTPAHWHRDGAAARLLTPLSWVYRAGAAARGRLVQPWQAGSPVLCVGNLVAGGAGKTPVALALAQALAARGARPGFLSRGHGGALAGPVRVDPARHTAAEVGDEPLLLAETAPAWVARDRPAGARAAMADGVGVIVMDDGLQNPALAKTVALVVIDGGYGFGNGRVIPAGPLRQPVAQGLARADAVVLVGEDKAGILPLPGFAGPVLRADIRPVGAEALKGRKVLAFAGIGRPEKFFRTLEGLGARLVGRHAFPDHHRYRPDEIRALCTAAQAAGAVAATTAKDHLRLPPPARAAVRRVDIAISWRQPRQLAALLDRLAPGAMG